MNIFIGNLTRETTDEDLRQAFEKFGEVISVNIIKDRYTSEPKGFGFVEMPSKTAAQSAIDEMNGKELNGKPLTVNEARPRNDNRKGKKSQGKGFGGGRRF